MSSEIFPGQMPGRESNCLMLYVFLQTVGPEFTAKAALLEATKRREEVGTGSANRQNASANLSRDF